jgi:hypothetical protein
VAVGIFSPEIIRDVLVIKIFGRISVSPAIAVMVFSAISATFVAFAAEFNTA